MAEREDVVRVSSGGQWEQSVGYARAVAAGPFVLVSGTTAAVDGDVRHDGDPYAQTVEAFRVAERALGQLGATLADVVRTRMYVVHMSDAEEVGRAHRELFGEVRPASTMVAVAGLIDPRLLVEVEVVAYRAAPPG